MRIAFVVEDNDQQKIFGAVERRRLFALIPWWEKEGCEIFPWEKGVSCDVIYIVNLPSILKKAGQVFLNRSKGQAVVVGMIEDFDTARWAAMCNESIDDIGRLIKVARREEKTLKGRLRAIRNRMAKLGVIQTPRTKVEAYIHNADAVLCTSELQAAALRRYNPNVIGVADCIPEDDYRITDAKYAETLINKKKLSNSVILVWEGTAWGMQLLELIRNPINAIAENKNLKICLRLIAPRYRPNPLFGHVDNEVILKNRYVCEVERHDWDLQTVGALVHTADIGLAPMPMVNPFYRAKAFSKPLVYMSAGLPVVASNIPAYCDLIENGINGFIAQEENEWKMRLEQLISNRKLRIEIGLAAKNRVLEFHSVEKVAMVIKNVFKTAIKIARL